jgi:hypothetical protein
MRLGQQAQWSEYLWITTVDGQAAAKKKVFDQLFNDLAAESYRAFRAIYHLALFPSCGMFVRRL